jgi:CBS domain containing-hemolysin-like protein
MNARKYELVYGGRFFHMDEVGWWLYAMLLFFIFLGSYFAASEISLASVNQARIRIRADKGDKNATKALVILDSFDKAISTILIGNNVAHIFAASLATLITVRLWGAGAVFYATIITTIVVFLVSEMLPKTLAKNYSERVSLAVAPSLYALMVVLTPFTFVFYTIGNLIVKVLKGDRGTTVTEEEFYEIIESIKEEGAMENMKGEWVHTALNFGDITVEHIMTVRTDVLMIDIDDDPEEILEIVKKSNHSRLPVYQDTIDNVIGILQIRRYFRLYYQNLVPPVLKDLLDPPFFTHHKTFIDDLLPEMSKHKTYLAVVTNNFGGTLGIVTIEDILEELVGEIWDEDDVAIEHYLTLPDGTYEIDASVLMEDVFDYLDYNVRNIEEFAHTNLGSWTYETLGRIPKEGDRFIFRDLVFEVFKMNKRRVTTVRIKKTEPISLMDKEVEL